MCRRSTRERSDSSALICLPAARPFTTTAGVTLPARRLLRSPPLSPPALRNASEKRELADFGILPHEANTKKCS